MHVVPNSIPDVEGFVTSLVRNVPGAVYRCDVDADFTMQLIGDEVERISGYPVDDFIGNARRSFDSIIHEDDREGVHRDVARALASGDPYVLEYRIVTASGDVRWILDRGLHAVDAFGRQCLDGIIFDVTRRRVAEEARLRSEAAAARAAELEASRARIIDAADEARRRLERDLHDGAQQRLVAASLALRVAERRLADSPQDAAMMLVRARTELEAGLEELRELARGIHPAVLTDHGLTDALHALAERVALPVRIECRVAERLAPGRDRALLLRDGGDHERRQARGRDAREGAPPARRGRRGARGRRQRQRRRAPRGRDRAERARGPARGPRRDARGRVRGGRGDGRARDRPGRALTGRRQPHDLGQPFELREMAIHRREADLLAPGGDELAHGLGDALGRPADRAALGEPGPAVHLVEHRGHPPHADPLVVLDGEVHALGDGECSGSRPAWASASRMTRIWRAESSADDEPAPIQPSPRREARRRAGCGRRGTRPARTAGSASAPASAREKRRSSPSNETSSPLHSARMTSTPSTRRRTVRSVGKPRAATCSSAARRGRPRR